LHGANAGSCANRTTWRTSATSPCLAAADCPRPSRLTLHGAASPRTKRRDLFVRRHHDHGSAGVLNAVATVCRLPRLSGPSLWQAGASIRSRHYHWCSPTRSTKYGPFVRFLVRAARFVQPALVQCMGRMAAGCTPHFVRVAFLDSVYPANALTGRMLKDPSSFTARFSLTHHVDEPITRGGRQKEGTKSDAAATASP
jgi:hypothetical protein